MDNAGTGAENVVWDVFQDSLESKDNIKCDGWHALDRIGRPTSALEARGACVSIIGFLSFVSVLPFTCTSMVITKHCLGYQPLT